MVGQDREDLSVPQRDGCFREERSGKDEFPGARADGIDAQGGEDIPGTHLAAVLVAADAFRRGGVHRLQQFTDDLLGVGGIADPVVHPGAGVAGLVAMGILAHEAGDIGNVHLRIPLIVREEGIQGGVRGLGSAHEGREAGEIVRGEETALPRDCLGEVAGGAQRAERSAPVAVRLPAADKARRRVEEVPIAEGTGVVLRRNIRMAQRFGHSGDAPVVVGELEGLGDGFDDAVAGGIAILVVGGRSRIQVGRGDHRGESLLTVEGSDPAQPGIGDDRDGMVADHAVGVGLAERPHGQPSVTVVHVQEAEDHILHQVGAEEHLERIPAAEGVPQGKRGIILPAFRNPDHLLGVVAVAAVHVGLEIRRHHRMVEGGIEGFPLFQGAAFDRDRAQFPGPFEARRRPDLVEAVGRGLRQAVVLRTGHIDRRDTYLHGKFLGFSREGQEPAVGAFRVAGREGDGEGGGETDVAAQRPAVHDAAALHEGVAHGLEDHLPGMGFPDIVLQVDEDVPLPFPGERVTMHTGMRSGREFRRDARIRETDTVVARGSHFIGMGERDRIHGVGAILRRDLAQGRREQEISEVRTAGTGEVRMGKAQDGLVAFMVAAAPVPGPVPGVRAQLDHPLRGGRSGIGMSMESGPYEGIRQVHRRFHGGTTNGRQHQAGEREKICAHNQSVLAFWLHANITNKQGKSDSFCVNLGRNRAIPCGRR